MMSATLDEEETNAADRLNQAWFRGMPPQHKTILPL